MALAQLSLCWDGSAPRRPGTPTGPATAVDDPVLQRTRLRGGRPLDSATDALRRARSSAALHALRAVADRYAETAAAERTRTARAADWNAFEAWCNAHALRALPAEIDTLRCYLAALAQRGLRASTIRRARCSIGLHHEQHGLPRPDQTCRTRQVERGIARTIGTREIGATPLLAHDLAHLVDGLDDATARSARDRVLLLLGFGGGFRTSELAALRVEDLVITELGVRVLVRRGKEDPLGRGKYTTVPRGTNTASCPIRALEHWLEHLGRPLEGLLFRRIDGARIRPCAMGERAVSRAVQRAAARAGLRGKYSSHSLRAGLCTSAYVAGKTIREIADHCRMDCPQTVYRYLHPERVPGRPNVAAGLL